MSIYGSQLFKLYDKNSVHCILYICPWKKAIRENWKIPNISHCRLLFYLPISRVVIGREVDYRSRLMSGTV